MSLIIVNESAEFLEKVGEKFKVKIATTLLKDLTNSLALNPNSAQNIGKVHNGIALLAK